MLEGYTIRVLAAAHRVFRDGDSVLYDITGPHGDRVLWATDTGPLPGSTLEAVRDARFDAVFLEETFGTRTDLGAGHHDLTTFPRTLAALREAGAVTDTSDVVAVHLSHYNPPTPELSDRLAPWGARVVDDGTTVPVGEPVVRSGHASRTLVLGGARAGKSTYAEALLAAEPRVTYLATGGVREGDREWAQRIALHRARRPPGWTTVETSDVVPTLRNAREPVLLDCLGTWLTARWTTTVCGPAATGLPSTPTSRTCWVRCAGRRCPSSRSATRWAAAWCRRHPRADDSGTCSGRSTPRSRPSRSRWC